MQHEVSENDSGAAGRVGRRALLGAGIGGAALSLLPFLSGRASASAEDTTTAPPKRPTDDDIALLAFAQQVELTARDLYDGAIGIGGWTDAEAAVMVWLRESHEAFAQALSGLLGNKAPGTRSDEVYAALSSDFRRSRPVAVEAARALESTAVATHLDVLGRLRGTDAAVLVASIQIAEARHCTALAHLSGSDALSDLLVDTEAPSLVGEG